MRRSDLLYADQYGLTATGIFDVAPATSAQMRFGTVSGLGKFLDYYLAHGDDSVVARMYLAPNASAIRDSPVANLRFQFNRRHQVAAVVLLAATADGACSTWVTADNVPCHGLDLAHDTWNPRDTRFPPTSYVHLSTLKPTLLEFAFGDTLPPGPASWHSYAEVGWF